MVIFFIIVVNFNITVQPKAELLRISTLNLGTSGQPVVASYYWLLETEKYQQDSLETVILNVSQMSSEGVELGYYYALFPMKNSKNKFNLAKEITVDIDNLLAYVVPMFLYHTRWTELMESDFNQFTINYGINSKGYYYTTNKLILNYDMDEIYIPNYVVEANTEQDAVNEVAWIYMLKMIEYCNNNDIKLVLMQTPVDYWTDDFHNDINEIAVQYDLEFYDFNYAPYIDEIDYNVALDNNDSGHLNYYGATKLTDWFGNYLTINCKTTDVRGLEEYAFMEEELRVYNRHIITTKLEDITDPVEYISYFDGYEDYTIFILVHDEATASLTENQKESFASFGLEELARLEYRGVYLGVIENGLVIYEQSENQAEEFSITSDLYVQYEGVTLNNSPYKIVSGYMTENGNVTDLLTSVQVGNEEYSAIGRGLNIVVYDNELGEVVDRAVFDTHASSTRLPQNIGTQLEVLLENGVTVSELSGSVKELYLYNLRCEDEYTVKELNTWIEENGFYQYLETFWDNENYVIFMSVQDEASDGFTEVSRSAFKELGLTELSELEYGNSYVAIIDGGNVVIEQRSEDAEPIQVELFKYEIVSGGFDAGSVSSILIDGIEYSPNTMGINVVIYNKTTELIVDSRAFDTYGYGVLIEE